VSKVKNSRAAHISPCSRRLLLRRRLLRRRRPAAAVLGATQSPLRVRSAGDVPCAYCRAPLRGAQRRRWQRRCNCAAASPLQRATPLVPTQALPARAVAAASHCAPQLVRTARRARRRGLPGEAPCDGRCAPQRAYGTQRQHSLAGTARTPNALYFSGRPVAL
jgi:hypothetical protein